MRQQDSTKNANTGNHFHFKKFSVAQDNVTWKVGTDGILLGAWCDVSHAESVLDLGTGTGLLALMIAQRNLHAGVTGIEIDPTTAAVASTNFAASPWKERLKAVCSDASTWSCGCTQKFDLIISNPPYFTEGLISSDLKRKSARSGDRFGMTEVLDIASRLLSAEGKLNVILPFEKAGQYIEQGNQNGLFCTRILHVRHKEGAKSTRSLVEFSRANPEQINEEHLTLYQGNESTRAYAILIVEFRDA